METFKLDYYKFCWNIENTYIVVLYIVVGKMSLHFIKAKQSAVHARK